MIEKLNITENLQIKIDSFAKVIWIVEKVNSGQLEKYTNQNILTFEQANHLREFLNRHNGTLKN